MSEKIEISVSKGLLEETPANVLVLNLFEGVKIPAGATGAIDIALDGLISKFIIAKEGFDGKFGKMYLLPTYGKIAAEKVLLVGLGKNKDFTPNRLRELSAKIIKKCRKMGNAKKVISVLHGAGIGGYDPEICARMITEGTLIGSYSFDKYKTEKSTKKVDEFVIVDMVEENCKKAKAGIKKGRIIGSAMNFARDLSNEQPAYATPSKLAEIAQSFKDLEVKVYDKEEIEKINPMAVFDATHPFAVQVTENIKNACEKTTTKYIRIKRDKENYNLVNREKVRSAGSAEEAAIILSAPCYKNKKVLLTTGSKTVGVYSHLEGFKDNYYLRMLPNVQMLGEVLKSGIKNSNVICMQGPFSENMNYEMIKNYGIEVMVTKNSGNTGGTQEKINAAMRAGTEVIIIEDTGSDECIGIGLSEALKYITEIVEK